MTVRKTKVKRHLRRLKKKRKVAIIRKHKRRVKKKKNRGATINKNDINKLLEKLEERRQQLIKEEQEKGSEDD